MGKEIFFLYDPDVFPHIKMSCMQSLLFFVIQAGQNCTSAFENKTWLSHLASLVGFIEQIQRA